MELSAWAGVGLIAYICCRGRLWLGCLIALAAAFVAVPLFRMAWDPEGSERVAEFLSRHRVGFLFGAAGGAFTGSAIAAVLCLPKDRNRWVAIGVFVVTGLFVALGERKSEIFSPFAPSGEDVWTGEVCLQTTDSTCGPASLATCLRALGLSGKDGDLAIESQTNNDGTLIADLARAAREHGATASFHAHGKALDVPLPAIASVTLSSGADHFVALIDQGGHRCIADPLNGIHRIENVRTYEWSGMFLSLSRAR